MSTTQTEDVEGLPGYSAQAQVRRQPMEHSYSLRDNKGRPWLQLKVTSRAWKENTLPLYWNADAITGVVELDLGEKSESIKAVNVTMRAVTMSVGQEEFPFLEETMTLWPAAASTSQSPTKLKGSHAWPFSMQLPGEVSVAVTPKGPQREFPLPPSFSERPSPAFIDYKLIVTVKRGTLRVNSTLQMSFVYFARSRAPPPSRLRQLAYRENNPLLGPEADPDGWKVLPTVSIKGNLFEDRVVEVRCTLALATPLSYASSSPLPLMLTFTSSDSQALDILSSPASINIRLVRIIATGPDATNDTAPRLSNKTFIESVGRAFFWPSREGVNMEGMKRLHGEIGVRKGLKATFSVPRLAISYTVSVFPFRATGFTPLVASEDAMLTEKVTIVTDNAPGVVPRSHAPPPGYGTDQGDEEADYSTTVGLLEAGSQRFYHQSHGIGNFA